MATLEQIQNRIDKLQRQADEVRRKQSASVIATILKMMSDYSISVEDLVQSTRAPVKKRGRPVGAQNTAKTVPVKGKLAPKYRNPETDETWSGHARPPKWIKDAPDRSVFLIAGASAAQEAGTNSAAKKVGRKPGRKAAATKVSRKAAASVSEVASAPKKRGRPRRQVEAVE